MQIEHGNTPEVGTLKAIGAQVGDVVELVHEGDGRNSYKGILWECIPRHPQNWSSGPCAYYKNKGTGWMPLDDDEWVFRIISRANPGPVITETITRKTVKAGIYDKLSVHELDADSTKFRWFALVTDRQHKEKTVHVKMTVPELRTLAETIVKIADAMEDGK
jgi:hypothetical protein